MAGAREWTACLQLRSLCDRGLAIDVVCWMHPPCKNPRSGFLLPILYYHECVGQALVSPELFAQIESRCSCREGDQTGEGQRESRNRFIVAITCP